MKKPTPIFSWKAVIIMSVLLLAVVIVSNFYGLLIDKFYFNKIDSYLFAILTLVHFVYLYAIWFKLKENEYPDTDLRNLEYSFYVVFGVYLYKIIDTASLLFGYATYKDLILPETFLAVGIGIVLSYLLLCLLTLQLFTIRKNKLGSYSIDSIREEELDIWS
ncbi:hypothetical protein MWU65_11890 [Cellulophaga sp. F20128]|uniref:hypothetical protein n=1 Tax=Cellulophaga sp. F20128 TaxID=2926413 RepID=UPI001FF5CF90|nr:hypothetical protein [Cellulophaga sp. F20128]MCK0157887.1 hypothetical protein [Cellulophaga sp. F20128]